MDHFKRPDSEQAILHFLDPDEREVYHRTKNSKGTFFVEIFHLKNTTEQEVLTIRHDRIVDDMAHYLTFLGPLRPIDKLGKAYDIWLDTTPDEEAVYYKRSSGGWAHWEVAADVSFPGIEREPRHLMFLPTRQFSIVGWFVTSAHRHIARTVLHKNDIVRLAYLSLTVRHGFTMFCNKFPSPLWSSLGQQLNRMCNDDNVQRYVKLALHNISKSDIKAKVQMNAFPPVMILTVKAWTDGRQLHEADHEAGYDLTVVNRPGKLTMRLVELRRGKKKARDSLLYNCTLDRHVQLEYSLTSDANKQSAILHLFPSMYHKLDGKAVHIMIKFETTDPSSAEAKDLHSFFENLLPLLLLNHAPKRLCLDPLWNEMCQSASDTQRKFIHPAGVYEKCLHDERELREHDDEQDPLRPFGNRVRKLHSDSEYVPPDEDDSTPSSQRRKRYPLRHSKVIDLDSDSESDSGDDRDEPASRRGQTNAPTQDNPRASSYTPTPSNTSSTRPSLSIIRGMKPRLSASKTNLAKQAAQENDKDRSNHDHQDPDKSLEGSSGQVPLIVATQAHNESQVAEVAKLNDDREHSDETSEGKIRGNGVGPIYDPIMENQRFVERNTELPGLDVDRKPNVQELDERHLLSAVSPQGSGSIDQPIVIDDDGDEDLSPPSSDLAGPLDIDTPKSARSAGGPLCYTEHSPLVDDSIDVEPTPGAQPGTIAESTQSPLTIATSLVNPSDFETSVQSNRPDITIGDAPRRPIPGCGASVKTEDLTEENSGTVLMPARRMRINASLEDSRSSRPDKHRLVSSNSDEGDDAEDIRPSKRARPSPLQQPPSKSGTSEMTHEDPLIAIYLEDERFDIQKSRFLRHSVSFSQVFMPDRGFRIGLSALVGPWMLVSKNAVRIIGVSAADFKSLLEALDDVYDFMFDTPVFPKLASILRASTVLGFTKVTRFVVNCLEHMWPSDLSHLSHTRIPYAIETIEIARKNDIPQIRKRAFYEVIKAAPDESIQDDNFGDMLSDKDRLLVYRVQAVFQKEWMMIAKAAPHTQCDKTQSAGSSSCCVHRDIRVQHWSVLVTESPIYDGGVQDIFYGLDRLSCLDWSTQGWCTVCSEDWRRVLEQKRMTLWSDLDRYVQQG